MSKKFDQWWKNIRSLEARFLHGMGQDSAAKEGWDACKQEIIQELRNQMEIVYLEDGADGSDKQEMVDVSVIDKIEKEF